MLDILFQNTANAAHSSGLPQTTQHQQIHYRHHANDSKYTNRPTLMRHYRHARHCFIAQTV